MTKRMTYQEKQARKALASGTPEDVTTATLLLLYCHIDLLLSGQISPKNLEHGKSSLQIVMMMINAAVLAKRFHEKNRNQVIAKKLAAATDTAKDAFQKSFNRSLEKRYRSIRVESERRKKQIQDWAHVYADAIRATTLGELYETSVMAERLFRECYVSEA